MINQQTQQGDATGGIIPYKNLPALIANYLGLFAIVPFLGILLGPVAIGLGVWGLVRRKKNPLIKGSVHAWIGIVCGFLFGVLWVLVLCSMMMVN